METLLQTPLRSEHVRLGGKLVPFAGWEMPVQYTGITDEHLAVRNSVGVFDISHMGQFLVSGSGAMGWLNRLLANNVAKLAVGQGQYSFLLNERGGVIDDLIVYRTGEERFFLVVNASMIAEDWAWMQARLVDGIEFTNASDSFAGMAVQGPKSAELYAALAGDRAPLPSRNGIVEFSEPEGTVVVCRTGYTGEDGFEFFCPAASGSAWLQRMVELGAKPCGLGARDTLRLEMCYPLNGNDLSPDRTPLEAGLGFFVDLEKGEFVGREPLEKQKTEGLAVKLAALKMTDKGPPPRAHYTVWANGIQIGELCSGGVSPSTNAGIAMAYLPAEFAKPGAQVEIDIRGKRYRAEAVKKPFYKKP